MRKSEGNYTKLYPYIVLHYICVWKTDAGIRLCIFAFTLPRPYLFTYFLFLYFLSYTFRPISLRISLPSV